MKVFVTGGTGYIGRSLVRALVRAGHEVTAVARDPAKAAPRSPAGVHWIQGDLGGPAAWAGEARGAEAIVHAAMDYAGDTPALDRGALEALLAVAREAKAPRTVVYTSGVWVLGTTGDKAADESATTDEPAAAVAWRPPHEKLALAASGNVTGVVLRPGMVYGQSGGLYAPFFGDAAKGASFVGEGKNRWPGVHVDDLADLYARIIEQAKAKLAGRPASERVFHGTDGVQERLGEVARAAAKAAGGKQPNPIPLEAARKNMSVVADAFAQDQVVVSPRAESVLGWRPRWRGFARNAPELLAEWKLGV